MKNASKRMKTDPIPVVRQSRDVNLRVASTLKPGKFMPVAAFNLLREDSCSGRLNFAIEMAETYELLMNKVSARISVWYMPHVANERFERNPVFMDKAMAGQPPRPGATVIPYIQTHAYGTAGANAIYKYLGVHGLPAQQVNTAYLEAYNAVWNFVARDRSADIDARLMTTTSLAPAFWGPSNMSGMVPDFDDGLIAGEVPLTVTSEKIPVRGIAKSGTSWQSGTTGQVWESDGQANTYNGFSAIDADQADRLFYVKKNALGAFPDIYAEMAQNGITVSLANMDQAKKLASFAKLRAQYEGHPDAYIIDMLMQGISIEEQHWLQPMLISQTTAEFRQALRHATDGASLTDKVTNGIATGSVGINVPQNSYGGVVMVFAEILPEQLYERQPDPFFTATGVDDLPNYFKDVMNPMPVVEVKNGEVDSAHSLPNNLFGYAERNWQWQRWPTRIGGDLYAPTPGQTITDARRRIWPTDVANPTLSEEFYLSTTLGVQPFMDTSRDVFDIGLSGVMGITGLTVIGAVQETEANYEELREKVEPLQPIK